MNRMEQIRDLLVKHRYWVIGLNAIVLQAVFLVGGLGNSGIGFPLDDSWIHQTYARNLMQYGSWSFIPGMVSGGSTSPLWTIILSPGFLFGGNFFFFWTLTVSCALLCGLAVLLSKCLENLVYELNKGLLILFGVVAALEWHLQWAAASGMETILYSFCIVWLVYLFTCTKTNWLLAGLLTGVLVWIRPDGLTFLGPIVFIFFQQMINRKFAWKNVETFIIPFILILGGYVLFNYLITGQIFPNTFYAKQIEYQALLSEPLFARIFNEFSPLWVGVCLFLVPGFVFSIFKSVQQKKLDLIGFILWVLGYGILFALRLPVIYQHGRYIMPVIPLFLLMGFLGTEELLKLSAKPKIRSILGFTVYGIILAISAAFFIRGIGAYHDDLRVIDTYMVRPAKWIEENTPKDSLIAVHDIGAMGFYTDRKLLDLAGLINPEVIPFIRDESRIENYIKQRGADYFVGFSDWYVSSRDWGKVIKTFNMNMDANDKEVDIIKLKN